MPETFLRLLRLRDDISIRGRGGWVAFELAFVWMVCIDTREMALDFL